MARRGRKPRHYVDSKNSTINGLYHYPRSDRWRVMDNGQEFREADEKCAIARFRAIQAEIERTRPGTVTLPVSFESDFDGRAVKAIEAATRGTVRLHIGLGGSVTAERTVPADQFGRRYGSC